MSERDDLEVVGEAADGNEAIEWAKALEPDLILMDLNMPNLNGVEATRRLSVEMPGINVLMLTVSDRDSDLFDAIKAGARGYLLKDEEPEQIIQGVDYVARGGTIVSPAMANKLLNEFKTQQPATTTEDNSTPSQREREVLRLVARGASNKEIAGELFISENTVKVHLRRILEKLHVSNRSQAAAYAARSGLAPEEDPPRGSGLLGPFAARRAP